MVLSLILGELTWEQNNSTKWSYLPKCILEILVSHHVAARNRSYFTGLTVERTLSQVYSKNIGNLMVRRIESTAESLLRNCSFSRRLMRILESSIYFSLHICSTFFSPDNVFPYSRNKDVHSLADKNEVSIPSFSATCLWNVIYSVSFLFPKASCWWFSRRKRVRSSGRREARTRQSGEQPSRFRNVGPIRSLSLRRTLWDKPRSFSHAKLGSPLQPFPRWQVSWSLPAL